MAVRNAQLFEDLQRRADRDSLTGLLNHRAFYERLGQELSRARREGTQVGVMTLDLDDFKSINDTRGHLAGDRTLALVAEALRDGSRDSDVAGRLGGDEFALILPSIGEDVELIARRLLAAIASAAGVAASLGIAVSQYDGQRPAAGDGSCRPLAARGQAFRQEDVQDLGVSRFRQNERDRRELEVLHRLALELPRSLSVTGVTDTLARELVEAVDRANECTISSWVPEHDSLDILSVFDRVAGVTEEWRGHRYPLRDWPESRALMEAGMAHREYRVDAPEWTDEREGADQRLGLVELDRPAAGG